MILPPEVVIRNLIKNDQFYLCHFIDITHQTQKPHLYYFLPIKSKHHILKCMITSQVYKLRNYYDSNKKASESIIYINKNDLNILKKQSAINCNWPELILRTQLINRIDTSKGIRIINYEKDISSNIKEKLIYGIENSPIVKGYIKKILIKKS